jgi:hypothetical protein
MTPLTAQAHAFFVGQNSARREREKKGTPKKQRNNHQQQQLERAQQQQQQAIQPQPFWSPVPVPMFSPHPGYFPSPVPIPVPIPVSSPPLVDPEWYEAQQRQQWEAWHHHGATTAAVATPVERTGSASIAEAILRRPETFAAAEDQASVVVSGSDV